MQKLEIAAIYPMSPLQEGMLFHSLYSPESGQYFVQFSYELNGPLQVEYLEQAWQETVARHPILRTAFVWENRDKPLQVVLKKVKLPFAQTDWRQIAATEQNALLEQFLQTDCEQGFDLAQAPLMRLHLFRLAEQRYQLVWTMHHLILDGWSVSLVFNEMLDRYASLYQKQQSLGLPPAPAYRDYITWLGQQDMAQAQIFWQAKLAGFEAATPLGLDLPRGSNQTETGYGEGQIYLSETVSRELRNLCKRYHLTLNTVLQGAWAVLLSRYSGEQDVVFGSVVAGRPPSLPGVEEMVGLFINTLPVRVKLGGQTPTLAWLKKLQGNQLELTQYEYSPLVAVQGWSEIAKGQALFESLYIFENYLEKGYEAADKLGLEVRDIASHERTNYPLTIAVVPSEKIFIHASYQKERFTAATIEQILSHWATVVENIVANPEQSLSQLEILSASERCELLGEFSSVAVDATAAAIYNPQSTTLHALVEEQAERTPQAIAVEFEGEQLSYAELNRRANRLAHYLQAQGVKRDQLVGVCLERSTELVVALLAILKAGGAYVPLDPAYPQERLDFMLADSRARLVISQSATLARVGWNKQAEQASEVSRQYVLLEGEWWADLCQPSARIGTDSNPQSGAVASNLAYMIYTSGSTGKPKGAMLEHRAICNHMVWFQQTFALTPQDAVLQKTPFSFDASVWEFWAPLLVGARLVMARPDGHKDPAYLTEAIINSKITIIQLVPSLLRALLDEPTLANCRSLRKVFCGGEALPYESFERLRELLPVDLCNLYGPTEVTIDSVYQVCQPDSASIVPIGRPVSNIQVYVLDANFQPVPKGLPGELFLGGAGLGRGYHLRPELTAEKFVPNPFAATPGERLYRTGDLVRFRADGVLDFLGRIDNQIKLRGFRIELGEIEAAIERYELVRQAVVLLHSDPTGAGQLVAYLVGESTLELTQLKAFLKAELPEYMIPAAFMVLEQLPLTANGKINRKLLPAPDATALGQSVNYFAPVTPEEQAIAAIWGQVLGLPVEKISANANFFELGGHSLTATQLVSRLNKAFELKIPLRAVFEAATILTQAQLVQSYQQPAPISEIAPAASQNRLMPRAGGLTSLPLSFAQQRMWFIDRLKPGSSFNHIQFVLEIKGELNPAALENSLNRIIQRHEVLRTNFVSQSGQPVQIIKPAEAVRLVLASSDLSSESAGQRLERARELTQQEVSTPFDLSRDQLLRAHLLKFAANEYWLSLTFHHICFDGWSMGVFTGELSAFYAAECRGQVAQLPELAIQYADYALWQRETLQGANLAEQVGYWREHLQGAPQILELPTDYPRPTVQSFRGGQISTVLKRETVQALKEFSQQQGVSLFMTLLTSFKALLSRYSGQEDIVIGTPIANRQQGETENLLGFFVNTLALRTKLGGNPRFSELLQRVKESALGGYTHQELPFERLVEELQPGRELSHTPIFQVMFVLQNAPGEGFKLDALEVVSVEGLGVPSARYDLTLNILEDNNGELGCYLEYSSDLFEETTVTRLLGHWQNLLANILANPQERLADLKLLEQTERQKLLEQGQTNPALLAGEYAEVANLCVHQIFEQQVARNPQAIALEFGDERLTYAELNRQANRLAARLRQMGVKPDQLVGVCLERSFELVVAVLAVLKAGGAYVPLDPTYPQERLDYMLSDSGVAILLTQSRFLAALPPTANLTTVLLDAGWLNKLTEQGYGAENLPNLTTVEHLAYLPYTSGSTGKPKGSLIPHRSFLGYMFGVDYATFDAQQTFLVYSSVSWDGFTLELWTGLLHGARCAIFRPGLISTSDLATAISKHKVTTLWLTSSLFNLFIDNQPQALQNVPQVMVGGEALSLTHLRTAACLLPATQIINGYGPSECTVFSSCYRLPRELPADWKNVPIGQPIGDRALYILDSQLEQVPAGVIGELYVSGASLARGYLNQPVLTASKFLPDPYATQPGSLMYRTGDLVRYRADGLLEFVGRVDQQVKIRGYRIELDEIETVIMQYPGMRECAVTVYNETGQAGDKRLVAYLTRLPNTPALDSQDLRQMLTRRMPDYMIPAAFVELAQMPLNSNGKLDYKALPAPNWETSRPQRSYQAPQTAIEQKLASVWAELLKVPEVGLHDNFFELGAHSLLIVQAHAKLQQVLEVELSVIELFEHPTISALARHLTSKQAPAADTLPIEQPVRTTTRTMANSQQRRQLRRSVQEQLREAEVN